MTQTLQANDTCWCGSGRKYKRCHKGKEGRVTKGLVTPMRPGPGHIARPPYAETGRPPRRSEDAIKSADVIARMRRAGTAAAEILRRAGEMVAPGVTTEEIDVFVHDLTIEMGGYPSTLNYHGYQKSLCTSVNEVICHGIPDSRALEDGDIVNLDVTVFIGGMHGDTSKTYPVGDIDPESARLVRVTYESMWAGIRAVRVGGDITDIGRAIQAHAEAQGFGVVRDFVGHGIGEQFHTKPSVAH